MPTVPYTAPIPANEDARLAELRRYAILDSPPEQAYDDVTALAAYVCNAPFSTITLVDEGRQWFKSELGFGARETERATGFCSCAILQPETMIVEDTLLDPRFANNPFVLGGPNIRFYAGAPLITCNGHVLGTICVFDTKQRVLSSEQIHALEVLARQVMSLLELRLKMRESQRNAEVLRTAEKLAAMGTLANLVAHEVNNPLQSVINLLYMAEMDGPDEPQSAYLSQAQEELARVTQIVTQTVRFHRQSHKPVPTMLAELLDSVRMLFRPRLKRSSLTLKIDDSQTVPLICHSADVQQVIANLVGNALDAVHGQNGSVLFVRIRDAVDMRTRRPGIRLTVADNGCGMDTSTQGRLFEAFFSTKGAQGTGLGLWVSKGILENHQAAIRIKSCDKSHLHGTVFTVFFPHQIEHR